MSPAPVGWTARVLLGGSLISAISFAGGFVLGSIGMTGAGAALSTVGVVAILLTPVAGLVMTIGEARASQRPTALAAVGVLVVLAAAVGVAVLVR